MVSPLESLRVIVCERGTIQSGYPSLVVLKWRCCDACLPTLYRRLTKETKTAMHVPAESSQSVSGYMWNNADIILCL